MKVKRTEVLDALSRVEPGLAAKEIVEQSQSFVFVDGDVLTFNDEIAIAHPLDVGIQGAVKADEFYKLMSKLKEDELDITTDGGELRVKGQKKEAGIRMEAEITLPLKEIAPPKKWTQLPSKFCDALKFCIFSTSTDMTKPALTCLYVNDTSVVSCDNFRLTRYSMGDEAKGLFPAPFLLPAAAARQLLKYAPKKYAIVGGWIHFLCATH